MKNEVFKDEILSDEQLEAVSGGNNDELYKDSDFMVAVGAMEKDKAYSIPELQKAFAKNGISVIIGYDPMGFGKDFDNEYYDATGARLTRKAALETVLKNSQNKTVDVDHYL